MKFTCNTKPLSTALDLGIINSNVSSYHKKSNIVQLTIVEDKLRINVETASIKTQLAVSGNSEGEGTSRIFVGSILLKQLISSIDTSTVTLDITDAGLVISAGKSNLTLPKLVDGDELELDAPSQPAESSEWIKIDSNNWKYIKENQLFALAMSFIHPVYTRIWVGESGDVLVGDYDNSLFTHSKLATLNNTCLLSDTVINLFTCLPGDSKLTKSTNGRDYLISATTDGFSYLSEFTPYYESDEGVGSYNSQIFLSKMHTADAGVPCKASALSKFLSQAELLSSTSEDTIKLSIAPTKLSVFDKNVNCSIDIPEQSDEYTVEFKLASLKKIISNYGDEDILIKPYKSEEGGVDGIIVADKTLTTILGGVEE